MKNASIEAATLGKHSTAWTKRRTAAGLAVLLSLLSGADRAEAAMVNGSFTGVMDGGTDTYGYFGTAGYNVTGQTITGTFSYDSALASGNQCSVPGEGCFGIPGITITETIAGTGSYTFHGTAPLISAALVLYGNFPAATSGADGFTLLASDGSAGSGTSTLRSTTLEIHSATNNFITDPLNPASVFSLTTADMSALSYGTINFSFTNASESLSFQFTSPPSYASSTTGTGTDIPEPSALWLFGVGLAALQGIRWRSRTVRA